MSPPIPPATTEPRAPGEANAWFVEELRQFVAPVAQCARLALAFHSPGETHWLTRSVACPCSQPAPEARGPAECRRCHGVPVTAEGGVSGTIAVCGPEGGPDAGGAVGRIIDLILRRIELQSDKELLQEELTISWECLEAVYDITANLRSAENTLELLERIIGKASNIQEGLRIVLWLETEGQLEVHATRHVKPFEPRPSQAGLIGQVMQSRQSLVVNDRARLATIEGVEEELKNADSVAIVPIVTRQSLLGALEVWKEGGQSPFDFRLMHLLDTLAILAATVVENDRLHRQALESERMQRDLDIGARIQQTLLLGRPPLTMPAIHAAALTVASQRIDGDFYDFFEHDKYLDVIVGDVMGKGLPAALLGAATKNHFLRAMNRLLAADSSQLPQPREIITILNPELVKHLVGFDSFVTLIYARFDLPRQRMEFIDCGHTKPIHYKKDTGTCEMLQGYNMPLGFSDADVYEQVSVPFAAGDIFLIYSDGVTEQRNKDRVMYGDARLAQLVADHANDTPQELVDCIRREIITWSASETFMDDLTCVAVKIIEPPAGPQTAREELLVTSALAELGRVRGFVRQFVHEHLDPDSVETSLWQLELAVTEAASNIMRHAYKGRADGQVRVELELTGSRIVLRLCHRGEPFDPGEAKKLELEGPSEGSMGRYIMQECLDGVRYYQNDRGEQCVELSKELKGTGTFSNEPDRQGEP